MSPANPGGVPLREKLTESDGSSALVIWAVFYLTVVFLITGIVYMFLKPLFKAVGQG